MEAGKKISPKQQLNFIKIKTKETKETFIKAIDEKINTLKTQIQKKELKQPKKCNNLT